MKKLVLISCSAAVALVGAVGAANAVDNSANDGDGKHRFGHRMRMMHALKEVGVTDAQRDQIRGILREQRPQLQPLRKQLVQERRALRDVVQTTPVNESAIRTQSARVAQVQADLAVQRARMAEKIRAVLTPEQVSKLKDLQAKRDARMDERLNRQNNGT